MNHETHVEPSAEAEAEAASSLTLLFDGLFFMCFAGPNDPTTECQVGFLTTAPDHLVKINVTESVKLDDGVTEKTDYAIDLSTARARSISLMELEIPGLDAAARVTRRGHATAIDREHPNNDNKEFFKWIIDLESREMHDGALPMANGILRPILKIKAGEFYAHELSQAGDSVETAHKYDRVEGNTKLKHFGAVASVIGVKINSLPQNKALLKAGDLVLPLVRKQGTTCEVRFQNRRQQPITHSDGGHEAEHQGHSSDFPLFYHAFRDIGALSRFDFKLRSTESAYPPAVCFGGTGCVTTTIP